MANFGSTILRYDCVSSTNDVARELAAAGAPEGLCVIAREQTAGRGRQGHSWLSPSGEGLYLSLIARPQIKVVDSGIITLTTAIAVAETFQLDFNTTVDIKWPNDVLASGKKICGILVESAIQGNQLQFVIIGIGVNIAQRSFPEEISDLATSLFLENSRLVEPEDFARPMLARLEDCYSVATSKPQEVITRWEELSSFARGLPVAVQSSEGVIEGVTRGLTPKGALILELDSGESREIVAGEVNLRATNASS